MEMKQFWNNNLDLKSNTDLVFVSHQLVMNDCLDSNESTVFGHGHFFIMISSKTKHHWLSFIHVKNASGFVRSLKLKPVSYLILN